MLSYLKSWIWQDSEEELSDEKLLEELDLIEKEKPQEIVKSGKVTELKTDSGLVDNEFFFSRSLIPKIALRPIELGDKIQYKAQRKSEKQQWVICEILTNYGKDDEDEWQNQNNPLETSIESNDVGIVVEVTQQKVFVEVQGEFCEQKLSFPRRFLDFVPQIGDLIGLNMQLQSEILDDFEGAQILNAKALRSSVLSNAFISSWWISLKKGIVDSNVYFGPESFSHSYVPRINDNVRVHAIECEPMESNRKCNWRATKLVPKGTGSYREKPLETSHLLDKSFFDEMIQDKFNVHIDDEIPLGSLQKGQIIEHSIEISNHNKGQKVILKSVEFKSKNLEINQNIFPLEMVPRSKAVIKIKGKANDFGLFKVLAIFKFQIENEEIFIIGTQIVMDVKDSFLESLQSQIQPKMPRFNYGNFNQGDNKNVIRGRRSANSRIFIKKRLAEHAIPKRFESLYFDQDPSALLDHLPFLGEDLNFHNYKDKFSNLLYLEELEQVEQMTQFSLSCVSFQIQGPYLALEVPGLAEKRPSLTIGDTAIAFRNSEEKKFEGCIHEVRSKSILLMFDERFHQFYCGEVYDIEFKMSRSQFKRMHQAIGEVEKNFGEDVLFPKMVKTSQPQVDFVLENPKIRYKIFPSKSRIAKKSPVKRRRSVVQTLFNEKLEKPGEEWVLPKYSLHLKEEKIVKKTPKKPLQYEFKMHQTKIKPYFPKDRLESVKSGQTVLKWVNKSLNPEQKSAVMRILTGQARPLPYVIYGPPGTGKTVTVVETIIQIFKLRPDSRYVFYYISDS